MQRYRTQRSSRGENEKRMRRKRIGKEKNKKME